MEQVEASLSVNIMGFYYMGENISDIALLLLLFCSPLYDWKAMEEYGFAWWVKRIKRALDLYDEFRIDHFRGLAGFWAVPSGKLNTSGCSLPASY